MGALNSFSYSFNFFSKEPLPYREIFSKCINDEIGLFPLCLGYIQNFQFSFGNEIKLNNSSNVLESVIESILDSENESFEIDDNILTITSDNFCEETINLVMKLLGYEITKFEYANNEYKIHIKNES